MESNLPCWPMSFNRRGQANGYFSRDRMSDQNAFGHWSYPMAKILYSTHAVLSLIEVSIQRLLLAGMHKICKIRKIDLPEV